MILLSGVRLDPNRTKKRFKIYVVCLLHIVENMFADNYKKDHKEHAAGEYPINKILCAEEVQTDPRYPDKG